MSSNALPKHFYFAVHLHIQALPSHIPTLSFPHQPSRWQNNDSLTSAPCLRCICVMYRLLFRNPMSWLNIVGCTITLLGCTLYGYVRQVTQQNPAFPVKQHLCLLHDVRPIPCGYKCRWFSSFCNTWLGARRIAYTCVVGSRKTMHNSVRVCASRNWIRLWWVWDAQKIGACAVVNVSRKEILPLQLVAPVYWQMKRATAFAHSQPCAHGKIDTANNSMTYKLLRHFWDVAFMWRVFVAHHC